MHGRWLRVQTTRAFEARYFQILAQAQKRIKVHLDHPSLCLATLTCFAGESDAMTRRGSKGQLDLDYDAPHSLVTRRKWRRVKISVHTYI